MKKIPKRLTSLFWFFLLLSINFNGCAVDSQIVYKDVPEHTIVYENKAYDDSKWGVYNRETIKNILEAVIEKDAELKNCLEREKIK